MSSGPLYTIEPIRADGTQNYGSEKNTVGSKIHKKRTYDDAELSDDGSSKEILPYQDSLYKYISWEDPVRSLGSYLGALAILFGAHYLPLTRWVLKAGATTFGAISVTEFASKYFGPNTFFTQIRPRQYKRIPEETLNATLQDVHDFVQYLTVEVQRMFFGEDLRTTFAAFIGFTTLYWVIKVLPPFWLTVLGITTVYAVPLVASPRGREVVTDAKARSEELAAAAAENGRKLAQDSKIKASELSSKAQETAAGMSQRASELTQSGKQMAADLSTQAKTTTSDTSKAAVDNVKKLPEMGSNAVYNAPSAAKSALEGAGQYISSTFSGTSNDSDNKETVTDVVGQKASELGKSAVETTEKITPDYVLNSASSAANRVSQFTAGSVDRGITADATQHPTTMEHSANSASTKPRRISGEDTDSLAQPIPKYAPVGDTAAKHRILNES